MESRLHRVGRQVLTPNEAEDGDVIAFVENTERV